MMALDEKISKLREKQMEEIEKAKAKISTIKAEYEKVGYSTKTFESKESAIIEVMKDYYMVVLNQIVNKPDLAEYENIANELERLLNKKKEMFFKLTYPLMKRREYKNII